MVPLCRSLLLPALSAALLDLSKTADFDMPGHRYNSLAHKYGCVFHTAKPSCRPNAPVVFATAPSRKFRSWVGNRDRVRAPPRTIRCGEALIGGCSHSHRSVLPTFRNLPLEAIRFVSQRDLRTRLFIGNCLAIRRQGQGIKIICTSQTSTPG